MKLRSRSKLSGEGFLPIIIVVVLLIGGGLWWLYSNKAATDREARDFARDVVKRLAVDHDRRLLDDRLGPQAKLDMPPSQRDYLIQRLTQFGVPEQPIQMDENVTFESYFFEPSGIFIAHLNYPGQGAMLQMATSHPVSRWQIDNVTFSTQRQAPPPAPAPAQPPAAAPQPPAAAAQPPAGQPPPAQSPPASPPQ